jgi:hypothetical protein
MEMSALTSGLRAIPLMLNNSLHEQENERLKEALRLKSAKLLGGGTLDAIQENWDGGIILFLPEARKAGDVFAVELSFQGKSIYHLESSSQSSMADCFYPLETTDWYSRHSVLKRSTFDLTFRHKNQDVVVAVGRRVREDAAPDEKSEMITEWKMDLPVALVTFAVGCFNSNS